MLFISLLLVTLGFASDNGYYYVCDNEQIPGYCKYVLTPTAQQNADYPVPAEWGTTAVEHTVDRSTDVGMRKIVLFDGVTISNVSPRPWTNGDNMVASDTAVTGDNWNYGLVFELIAPLRNQLMFHPDEIAPQAEWDKYTKALNDCGVKVVEDVLNEHGMPESTTAEVYAWLKNNPTSQHTGLQYLEEAAIDLVCLVTNLSTMERCIAIRERYGLEGGDTVRCDCWQDAYREMYNGEEPQLDDSYPFTTCDLTNPLDAPDDSTTTDEDTGNSGDTTQTGPHCCDGSDPDTSSGPPTCADGSTALPPTDACPEEEEDTTTTTTATPETDAPTTTTAYAWVTTQTGTCATTAGSGACQRTDTVECQETTTTSGTAATTTVADSFCDDDTNNAGTKPSTVATCEATECTTNTETTLPAGDGDSVGNADDSSLSLMCVLALFSSFLAL